MCEKCIANCRNFTGWTPQEIRAYNDAVLNPDAKLKPNEGTCAQDIEGRRLIPGTSDCLSPLDKGPVASK